MCWGVSRSGPRWHSPDARLRVMSSADSLPDPELLSRWLALTGLIASAEEMLGRRGGAWTALALVAADTASEAVLGFIATAGSTPLGDREGWDKIYDLALAALAENGRDLPPGLRARINRAHRLRNLALHVGAEPIPREAEAAVKTARDLMELASHGSPELEMIATAGPLEGVGRLVAMPPITDPLIAAAVALREKRYVDAADKAAIALQEALARVAPPLRPAHFRWYPSSFFSQPIGESLQILSHRAGLLEAWVLALGTGLRPVELAELRQVLGQPTWGANGRIDVNRDPATDLSPSAVESATSKTADVIFRLWHSDSLRPLGPERDGQTSGFVGTTHP
jgi:hypothetical protein